MHSPSAKSVPHLRQAAIVRARLAAASRVWFRTSTRPGPTLQRTHKTASALHLAWSANGKPHAPWGVAEALGYVCSASCGTHADGAADHATAVATKWGKSERSAGAAATSPAHVAAAAQKIRRCNVPQARLLTRGHRAQSQAGLPGRQTCQGDLLREAVHTQRQGSETTAAKQKCEKTV